MKRLELLFAISLSLCCACGPVSTDPQYPALAYAAPGVAVVTDMDDPVFFVDGLYWYWDGAFWSCSDVLGGPRARFASVPPALTRIDPARYAHYHAMGNGFHGGFHGARASMGGGHGHR